MVNCYFHPDRPAENNCEKCNKDLCDVDSFVEAKKAAYASGSLMEIIYFARNMQEYMPKRQISLIWY